MLVYGADLRGHVDGGTERNVRNREGVERVGGVRSKYWVPRERIRTQPIMCLVDCLVQVLYASLQGYVKHGSVLGAGGARDRLGEAGP